MAYAIIRNLLYNEDNLKIVVSNYLLNLDKLNRKNYIKNFPNYSFKSR